MPPSLPCKNKMRSTPSTTKFLLTAIALATLITLWAAFAPLQFGGRAGFVVLTGNSMSPEFKLGDLVVVRQQSRSYQIDDIVAYRHPEIGTVFHRIVDMQEDRFILKGDNNAWLDSYEPEQAHVIGKLWLHFPSLGLLYNFFRTPAVFALSMGLFAILLLRSARGKNGKEKRRSENVGPFMDKLKNNPFELLFTFVVIGLLCLILALVAFLRPATVEVAADIPFEHAGAFFYTAEADPQVYDAGTIQPGEPLFRRLTDSFMVGFAYELLAANAADLAGSYQLYAEVSDTNGWKRTVLLEPETEFTGSSFSVNSTLMLSDIQKVITGFETQTGLDRARYILSIKPVVQIQGTISGYGFQDRFAPALSFLIDDLQVQLLIDDPLNTQNSLQQRHVSMIPRTVVEPNVISLLAFDLPVPLARVISSVGLGVSVLVISLIGSQINRIIQQGEAARNELMYAPLMIEMEKGTELPPKPLVKVTAIDDLAKLAERNQGMILHDAREQTHHYYVEVPDATFHYELQAMNGHVEEAGIEVDHTAPNVLVPIRARLDGLFGTLPFVRNKAHLRDVNFVAIESWVKALEMRNHEEIGHTQELAEMTVKLAQEVGVEDKKLDSIRRGALLHDIGVMAVSEAILQKPGDLDDEEWDVIHEHPNHAVEILSPVDYLKDSLDIPRCHHERWDGSGYPNGLAGEEIPLAARVFAVVDVYDSLLRDRPDRKGWTKESAYEYIEAQSGWGFDPEVVDAFLRLEL